MDFGALSAVVLASLAGLLVILQFSKSSITFQVGAGRQRAAAVPRSATAASTACATACASLALIALALGPGLAGAQPVAFCVAVAGLSLLLLVRMHWCWSSSSLLLLKWISCLPAQALLCTWQSSGAALWQPALLSLATSTVLLWRAGDAALALRADDRVRGCWWLAAHLAACNLSLLGCAAAATLVASMGLAAASARAVKAESLGQGQEPLLSDAERGSASLASKYSSPRWRLIRGVSYYVWPDRPGLQLR